MAALMQVWVGRHFITGKAATEYSLGRTVPRALPILNMLRIIPGTTGKTMVASIQNPGKSQVVTQAVDLAGTRVLKQFVESHSCNETVVYTEYCTGYQTIDKHRVHGKRDFGNMSATSSKQCV